MLVFIVMNTGLLIRWSDKCAICLENYAGLKVFLWRIKKGKEPIKCWHLEEKETGKAEGTMLQSFVSVGYMQIFGQNSHLGSGLYLPNSRQISGPFLLFSIGGQRNRSVMLFTSRRVVLVLWKATAKSDGCSSLVFWWHVYPPSIKREICIFTLSAYLSHALPTHLPLRPPSLSTKLIYFLILVFSCFTLLKDAFSYIQEPGLKERTMRSLVGCYSHSPQPKQFLTLRKSTKWNSWHTSGNRDRMRLLGDFFCWL